MVALETNTVIDTIYFWPDQDHPNVDFSRFYNHIRARKQLPKLLFENDGEQFDFSEFLLAASENSSLHEIEIKCGKVYSNQALGSLRSHPQLKKICIRRLDKGDLERTDMIKQIIETCPRMRHIKLKCGHFTSENFMPIVKALYKVKPMVALELGGGEWNQEATALLQKFLHQCPNPVRYNVDLTSVMLPMRSSRLDYQYFVGPSVTELTINLGYAGIRFTEDIRRSKLGLPYFMRMLLQDKEKSLKKLWFENVSIGNDCLSIFDSIPDLLLIERIKIGLSPTGIESRKQELLKMKQQFIHALVKNLSITMADLHISIYCDHQDAIDWNDHELEIMQLVRERNEMIPILLASPNSIPLFAWPSVFQAVQKTNASTSLIFQFLRGLNDKILVSSGWDDMTDKKALKRRRI